MPKLTKQQFESHLGKEVKITLFDGDVLEGELHKTSEEQFKDNPNLYCKRGYYCLYCLMPISYLEVPT